MPMMEATSPRPPRPGLAHQDGPPAVAAPGPMSQAEETLRNPSTRPDATDRGSAPSTATTSTQPPASQMPASRDQREADVLDFLTSLSSQGAQHPPSQSQQHLPSNGMSQESSASTIAADGVFTPPASQHDTARSQANGHTSSQESQLLHLSQLASARHKMGEHEPLAPSKKRRADGEVKAPAGSPPRGGHSRNTSTVSMASTTASTIGDLSSDLKTRLTYFMAKVNNGWQANSIEEVESMASQAASPVSTTSTLPARTGSSASPRLTVPARNGLASSNPSPATYESFWRENGQAARRGHNSASPPNGAQQSAPTLAPPAPIQPARALGGAGQHPRRNSNPHYTPTLLSHSQSASPNTPGQSSVRSTQRQLGRGNDPILFSPHQDVREQDAIESLLFMSSPGNSGNMKHGYVPAMSASQPLPGSRHALPTSQPRKALPGLKAHAAKRVGFDGSPGDVMDIDGGGSGGQVRTPGRLRVNGGGGGGGGGGHFSPGHRSQLSLPAGLGYGHRRPRPRVSQEDIERMLDQAVAAENDSSDDEIVIPTRRASGAGVV